MAAQTKHDQCVALEMVGMKNCEVIKMLNFCRKKNVFNVEKKKKEQTTSPIPERNFLFVPGESLKLS